MMNGLVWPVVTAAILGLGYVAFNNPKQYERLIPWLYVATALTAVVLVVIGSAYSSGARAAFQHMSEVQPENSLSVSLNFDDNPYGISSQTFIIGFVVWLAYLFVLGFLPSVMGSDDAAKPTKE